MQRWECKLGKSAGTKGRAIKIDERQAIFPVKCMHSRSKREKEAKKVADELGIAFELVNGHHDSYYHNHFDYLVATLSNCCYVANNYDPTKKELEFLDSIGYADRHKFHQLYVIASATDIASMPRNGVHCPRKTCNGGCGFIPNYPQIVWKRGSPVPELPWKVL